MKSLVLKTILTIFLLIGSVTATLATELPGVCAEKLFIDYTTVYACDIKKDTSGVKAPIKNACYFFSLGFVGDEVIVDGDFFIWAGRPRNMDMGCSCEPTGFNTIMENASNFFLCNGAAFNPFTENYEPAGFRGKAFITSGVRKIIGEFQMGKDVWKIKCRINNSVCPQEIF